MDEYREKIAKLSVERLSDLVEAYQKSISYLENQHREATVAAMLSVAQYTGDEIKKKKAELEIIEKILKERQQEQE
ncbi:MAG TPA: hypothetical protein VH186_36940 [Chloroflexia bacterium]|nr:hypothetical protein [Chloroflexia bacterium]